MSAKTESLRVWALDWERHYLARRVEGDFANDSQSIAMSYHQDFIRRWGSSSNYARIVVENEEGQRRMFGIKTKLKPEYTAEEIK